MLWQDHSCCHAHAPCVDPEFFVIWGPTVTKFFLFGLFQLMRGEGIQIPLNTGHHRPAIETPFKWCFAGPILNASLVASWFFIWLGPVFLRNPKTLCFFSGGGGLQTPCPLPLDQRIRSPGPMLLANEINTNGACAIICLFHENWCLKLYKKQNMYKRWHQRTCHRRWECSYITGDTL